MEGEKESKEEREREREEENEGCSSVSALWSRASWDSRTLCQDSALQNQSLSTEHKEKDAHNHTHVHTLTCKQIYTRMLQAASLSGFGMAGSLGMSQQRVVVGRRGCTTRGEEVGSPTFSRNRDATGLYYLLQLPMRCRGHLRYWCPEEYFYS